MSFNLVPFSRCDFVASIAGEFQLSGESIICQWILVGTPQLIRWPASSDRPHRKMSLWEHTCFEFFIGSEREAAYYEFNLSPSGHWNSFGFSDVRKDMTETHALIGNRSTVAEDEAGRITVTATASFAPRGPAGPFLVGVSAVIEGTDGRLHYFALSHDGARPDFHRRSNHRLIVA